MRDPPGPTDVLPHLMVGNSLDECSRTTLINNDITHVLCVEAFFRRHIPGIQFLHIPLSDAGTTDLSEVLPQCFAFIEGARAAGGKVLLHCFAGMNRAPTVTLAYLMTVMRWKLRYAWALLKERRPIVSPCIRYKAQLLDIEEDVFGENSITMEEWEAWGVLPQTLQTAETVRRDCVMASASLLPPIRVPTEDDLLSPSFQRNESTATLPAMEVTALLKAVPQLPLTESTAELAASGKRMPDIWRRSFNSVTIRQLPKNATTAVPVSKLSGTPLRPQQQQQEQQATVVLLPPVQTTPKKMD